MAAACRRNEWQSHFQEISIWLTSGEKEATRKTTSERLFSQTLGKSGKIQSRMENEVGASLDDGKKLKTKE